MVGGALCCVRSKFVALAFIFASMALAGVRHMLARFLGGVSVEESGKGRLRLRLVTSQGPPYPSRSPRAHPSGMLVCHQTLGSYYFCACAEPIEVSA